MPGPRRPKPSDYTPQRHRAAGRPTHLLSSSDALVRITQQGPPVTEGRSAACAGARRGAMLFRDCEATLSPPPAASRADRATRHA